MSEDDKTLYRVDYENNAAVWWYALMVESPELCEEFSDLIKNDQQALTPAQYERLTKLPGWDVGPEYARHPIIPV